MFIDTERMGRVVRAAFDKAVRDLRWQMAITRAARELELNPYMHWNGSQLLVLSPSMRIYVAGRGCQCEAYAHYRPCWHRAAARLLKRYAESESSAE